MTEGLLVYNNVSERTRTIKDLEEAKDFLSQRTKATYLLKGIEDLEIVSEGLLIAFNVIETDDHLIKKGMPEMLKTFFISRYVFRHLANFLGMTSKIFDFIQSFLLMNENRKIICQEHMSAILKELFNHRLEQQQKNSRIRDIYLTVFSDGFGEFPRVIHSEIYYPFPDSEALTMLLEGLKTVAEQNPTRQYHFKNAQISPYQSTFNFTNAKSRTEIRGDSIESGISVMNSECKMASFNFQDYVWRQICANGLRGIVKDNDLRVKHYEAGFQQKIQAAFVKALRMEDEFASKYIETVKYDQKISNDWADLLDIPNSILALNNAEKSELVEIGRTKYGEFTPYNVVNAITDKATHRCFDDNSRDRFNEKAVILIDNIEALSIWEPKTKS